MLRRTTVPPGGTGKRNGKRHTMEAFPRSFFVGEEKTGCAHNVTQCLHRGQPFRRCRVTNERSPDFQTLLSRTGAHHRSFARFWPPKNTVRLIYFGEGTAREIVARFENQKMET